MKRLTSLLLTVSLAAMLAACGGSGSTASGGGSLPAGENANVPGDSAPSGGAPGNNAPRHDAN